MSQTKRTVTILCILYTFIFTANSGSNPEQTITWDIYECPRHRQAWHLLSSDDRLQYANAIHTLNNNGKLLIISRTHHNWRDAEQAHFTSGFFPWHRYLLYQIENQIRLISEDYKCFSLPYWDISHEASREDHPFILKSYLGGNAMARKNKNYCVDSLTRRETKNGATPVIEESWSVDAYPLTHMCSSNELSTDSQKCCLKRELNSNSSLFSAMEYAQKMRYHHKFYGKANMHGFCYFTFNRIHGTAHQYIGGTHDSYNTQFISLYAPDDPIFFLLHTWIDFLWTVWMNCHGYDQISPSDLDSNLHAFQGFKVMEYYPDSGLDDRLVYLDMDGIDWWPANGDKEYVPTARKMYDISKWNVVYSMGTFIKRSKMSDICNHPWNDEWLVNDYASYDKSQYDEIESPTIIETYADIAYEKMKSYLKENGNYDGIVGDLFQSLAAKSCAYQRDIRGQEVCYIEHIDVEYEKCSNDMSEAEDTYDITLDEMLNKKGVKGNICLEKVRTNEYGWRKTMKRLTALCNGVYDVNIICEHPKIDFDPNQEIEEAMKNVDIEAIEMRLAKEYDSPAIEEFAVGMGKSSFYFWVVMYVLIFMIGAVVLWLRRKKIADMTKNLVVKKRRNADILLLEYGT